jgi:hypothetical protein
MKRPIEIKNDRVPIALSRTGSAVNPKKIKRFLTLDCINPNTKSSKLFLCGSAPQGGLTKVIVVDWLVWLGWVSERDESQVDENKAQNRKREKKIQISISSIFF